MFERQGIRVFDVWIVPHGRSVNRVKVCVTLDPTSAKSWAADLLRSRAIELYPDPSTRTERARWLRIEITARPDNEVIWWLRWNGESDGAKSVRRQTIPEMGRR